MENEETGLPQSHYTDSLDELYTLDLETGFYSLEDKEPEESFSTLLVKEGYQ